VAVNLNIYRPFFVRIENVFLKANVSDEKMGIIISIVIALFLLGSWLLAQSANNKLPPNVKSKPYLDV
jgi:hypothetical protein